MMLPEIEADLRRVVEWQQVKNERMRTENRQLRKALDTICGIVLGCRDSDIPAAKIHRIAVDALMETLEKPYDPA